MPAPLRPCHRRCPRPLRAAQRGVSLIFSMVTLVVLSLAAVALIRAVDTSGAILGNLGFKQDTLLAADDATRQAVDWISAHIGDGTLHADATQAAGGATGGYYASDAPKLDPTGQGSASDRVLVDWGGDSCGGHANCRKPFGTALSLANGVRAQYLIQRLCSAAGDPQASGSTLQCAQPLNASTLGSTERGAPSYDLPKRLGTTVQSQYYRIVVRANGPRKTVSYTDTLVHY